MISDKIFPKISAEQLETQQLQGMQTPAPKLFTQADAYEEFITKNSEKNCLCKLIRLMICFSTNSAGSERMFSLQNRIKTKARNRLSDLTLNDAMHIIANRVEQENMDFMSAARQVCDELPSEL